MSETSCTRLAENTGRKNRHLGIIAQLCRAISSQLRHVSTVGKNLLNGNISSICSQNILNFSLLTAEICWRVWGTPAKFNGFRVLASLLQRRGSTEVDQSLHYVRPYPGLVYCIYILGSSLSPDGILPRAKFTLCPATHHRTSLSGYIFGTKACIDNRKKNLLNSNTSSTCPDNMANLGLLKAEICWRVWGTPANFNGFRVFAALLHGALVVGVTKLCGVEQRAPPTH